MTKIRLDNTKQVHERFRQKWTIIDKDGNEHCVTSDSEWSHVVIKKGGNKIFDINGVQINSGQMVAIAISCGLGPTTDGEDYEITENWIKEVEASGIDRKYLADPV